MELDTTDKVVDHVREWSIDKIEAAELVGDKMAIYAEFEEWIELDDVEELDIVSLCDKGVSGSTTITPDDV